MRKGQELVGALLAANARALAAAEGRAEVMPADLCAESGRSQSCLRTVHPDDADLLVRVSLSKRVNQLADDPDSVGVAARYGSIELARRTGILTALNAVEMSFVQIEQVRPY